MRTINIDAFIKGTTSNATVRFSTYRDTPMNKRVEIMIVPEEGSPVNIVVPVKELYDVAKMFDEERCLTNY